MTTPNHWEESFEKTGLEWLTPHYRSLLFPFIYRVEELAYQRGLEAGALTAERKRLMMNGEDWGFEEELRLKVNFDKNQDREVCILFIRRLIAQERADVLRELEGEMRPETENKDGYMNKDYALGLNTYRAEMLEIIRKKMV